jgi:hypothetical protein
LKTKDREWEKERQQERTGGNADGCENKGVAEKATQKILKTKE